MNKKLFVASALFVGLLALIGCGVRPWPREKVAIWAEQDSWVVVGHDFLFFSDLDMTAKTLHLYGDSGAIYATGTITATDVAISGDITMRPGGRIVQTTGAVTVADALAVSGIIYANDDIQAKQDVRISDLLILEDVEPSHVMTVTSEITNVRSYQRIVAEAWVSPTVGAGCVPGTVWILYNWGDKNIHLADSGSLTLASDFTMGQHDILALVCNYGGNWAEWSRSDN